MTDLNNARCLRLVEGLYGEHGHNAGDEAEQHPSHDVHPHGEVLLVAVAQTCQGHATAHHDGLQAKAIGHTCTFSCSMCSCENPGSENQSQDFSLVVFVVCL